MMMKVRMLMTSLSNDDSIAFEDTYRLQVTIRMEHCLLVEEGSPRVPPWLPVDNELTSCMPIVIRSVKRIQHFEQ
jgi:hypothetical protein